MQNLLFCIIPYYLDYDGTEAPDDPTCMNFLPVDIPNTETNETFELLFGTLQNQTLLPKEICEAAAQNSGFVSDVTVVFCAKADNGALVTIGWYIHANVTPKPEYLPLTDEDGKEINHPFFFCTQKQNGFLLPPNERYKPQWQIPRGRKKGAKFGFPADTVWLCEEADAAAWRNAFHENLIHYTDTGENYMNSNEV